MYHLQGWRVSAVLGTAGVVAGWLGGGAAYAAVPGGDPGAAACIPRAPAATRTTAHARDPHTFTATQAGRLDSALATRLASMPAFKQADRLAVIRIPVAVHVLAPNHRTVPLGHKGVARQIAIMNRSYAGRQRATSTPTPFRFRLRSSEVTVNRNWYHSDYHTSAEKRMKRALHVGDAGVLNLYVVSPPRSKGTLGWATFPQKVRRFGKLDGVAINVATVKGGSATGYNRGDTAVHETGHWLGLFHTFQGGCSARNDRVTDTPAEATPQFACEHGSDTCKAPGEDPIHNFMDYSYDSCMYTFTEGQDERMRLSWLAYRR